MSIDQGRRDKESKGKTMYMKIGYAKVLRSTSTEYSKRSPRPEPHKRVAFRDDDKAKPFAA